MRYSFNAPTRVEVGPGISSDVGRELRAMGINKVLVVTDPGIVKAGLLGGVERSLLNHEIDWRVFDEVSPNPRDYQCSRAAELCITHAVGGIVAIGGGSAMDTAKAAAALVTNGGEIQDYEGYDRFLRPGIPVICLPTTAGTASEISSWVVITSTRPPRTYKLSAGSFLLAPKVALLDPELLLSLPTSLTASTGMDALTHAIESYVARNANPVSEALSIGAVEIIARWLPISFKNGKDLHAREMTLVGSMMAGMALSNSDVGAVHCLGEAVGGVFDIPHGVANAALLPYVMAFNLEACTARMARIGVALGCKADQEEDLARFAIRRVEEMNVQFGIPHLKDLGVTLDRANEVVDLALANASTQNNPRTVTAEDYHVILSKAVNGENIVL